MLDFALARRMMVDGQIRTNAVTDPRIIAAMLEIPRENFVPAGCAGLAYLDRDLSVGGEPGSAGRRLLKPMVLAKLIQSLEIGEGGRVLAVAPAMGYSVAMLERLGAAVVALDDTEDMLAAARRALGAESAARLVHGPLAEGWASGAPYDATLVEGAIEVRPETLLGQLQDGGKLAVIEGRGPAGRAMLYRSDEGEISSRPLFAAAASVLPGFVEPAVFTF
jgi:protein-L-isoaspartate(D-aspartate) O-methyltransferase